jgi:Bacterial membrane protein YfhO
MENSWIKNLLPHGIAVAIMLAVSFVFFSPIVFDGKVLQQPDNQKAAASQTEVNKFRNETGKSPFWTNSFFGGMPTYQIHLATKNNLTQPVFYAMLLGKGVTAPHANIWIAMLSMYLLLLSLRVDWRLSLMGALSFGLSSFNMDILEAGHSTKMIALAYAPMVLAGAIFTFRKSYLLGGGLFGLAFALQILSNHVQITYYTGFILLTLGIIELINALRNSEIFAFGKAAATLVVAAALAVGANATILWTTQEYQSETQRGTSQLANSTRPKEGGLDKKYAFDWSYGVGESFSLVVQNCCGGGASQTHQGTETFDRLFPQVAQGMQGVTPDKARADADRQISGLFYTGSQPFVGVSIYWGAIASFLFLAGFFISEGRKKWFFGVSTLLMLMIAWGKNFFFAPMMFDMFPLFNKFRAVTQALGLGQLTLIAGAAVALQAFFDPSVSNDKKQKALMYGLGLTVVMSLLALVMCGDAGKQDAQLQPELRSLLEADRAALARSDAFRSIILAGLSAGLIWLTYKGRLKTWMAVAGLGALTLFDSWTVAKRILSADKFDTKIEAQATAPQPTEADKAILADTDPHYRVLDLRGNDPFQNAATSHFHKSIGGYHAAKLMLLQEMMETHLGKFDEKTPLMMQKNMPLYGMMNVKYVIMEDSKAGVQINPFALGNAWFVRDVKVVETADAELAEIGNIDPRKTLVVQKKYADLGKITPPQYDSAATIKLTSYNPDRLEYSYTAAADQIAAFSEVYYPAEKGWTLTVDGQPATFVKANYLLRAAKVPAGSHKIVMEFAPKSFYTGEKIALISSALILLLFLGGLFWHFRKNGLSDAANLPEEFEAEQVVSTVKATTTTTTATTETPAKPKAKLSEKPQPKNKK